MIGRFERLAEGMRAVSDRIGVDFHVPEINRSRYLRRGRRRGCFADCPLAHLRKLPLMPDYREFYTPRLRDRVAELYRRDVEQFGYEFNG